MNEPVHTIVWADDTPQTACPSASNISSWKLEAEEREESEVRKALRELSAPPPYFYNGRRKRCFFPQRKTRWRKG